MCGLLGEISTQLIEESIFQNLLDLSLNRGPDQQGIWHDNYCKLGLNRLSIIDLEENAKQPILSPSGKFVIVFNGEVYNYKEIQNKYNISDNALRSLSDSEILAHLIDKVSIDVFAKELNGMFAIVIYDIENKIGHLVRDFAGIKPLFYGVHSQGIIFASQFDQIFQHPVFIEKKLRPEIMKEYFGLGYMQAPNTVFENIFQVEPGQIISWSFNELSIVSKAYYYKWEEKNLIKETSLEVTQKLKSLLTKVIKTQLNADVSVASFLSGGIDSSLVSAIIKQSKPDIVAYTFGIDDADYDESQVASNIANQIKVKHCLEIIDESELLNTIEIHFEKFSEPFGDESSVPTYLITKKAKEDFTVMISGDGGDELFWGYPRFLRSVEHLNWFKMPLFLRKIIAPFHRKFSEETSSSIDVFLNFDQWILDKQMHFKGLNDFIPNTNFSQELYDVYSFNTTLNKKNALRYLKKNEFYGHLQKVLRKVDLMSMANNIEVRVPLLDKEIIEFSNTIIPEYGINHKTPKLVLRNLLNQFVDKEITSLPKKGFSIPIKKWLKNELKDDFIKTVIEKPFFGKEYINESILLKNIHDFYDQEDVNASTIWHLYAWQKWAINNNLI
ncbi:MAG: asparagine synthase (glutamine-hydrolyzing) [Flavobacterium sp.]|uniref:asparagine synthase (glutamine-hydrolyzing) n=1 Tax=Flavobacterium sp. TaxID=239 RepID=UPI00326704EC